jgi:hypothetical protein
MLVVWMVTLPMTLPFIAFSGMAADAGDHWFVYVFIWSAITYPLTVLAAFVFRRKYPRLVFLPCINITLYFFAGSFGGG